VTDILANDLEQEGQMMRFVRVSVDMSQRSTG
jgi:hypothetical protein